MPFDVFSPTKTSWEAVTVAKRGRPKLKADRYLRASRILVGLADPTTISHAELALQANMSKKMAGSCVSAYLSITRALRDVGLLRKRPKKSKKLRRKAIP
jgi:hypothetical protein